MAERKAKTDDVEVVEEAAPIRISVSIDPSLRKNMRIAAAHADLTVGEWATKVLTLAAQKATGIEIS